MTNTHGGARQGAGRKPSPSPLKPVTVRLSPDDILYLQTLADKPGEAIRQLIKQARS